MGQQGSVGLQVQLYIRLEFNRTGHKHISCGKYYPSSTCLRTCVDGFLYGSCIVGNSITNSAVVHDIEILSMQRHASNDT